jgi:hypothetical protein
MIRAITPEITRPTIIINVSKNHSLCTGVHLPGNREAGVAALFVKDGIEAADVFFVIGRSPGAATR